MAKASGGVRSRARSAASGGNANDITTQYPDINLNVLGNFQYTKDKKSKS